METKKRIQTIKEGNQTFIKYVGYIGNHID